MFLQSPRNELPDHFLGFANPTRLRILQRLGEVGEVNVTELAEYLHMSQPRISWHVRMLRLGGIIRVRRDGRQVWSRSTGSRSCPPTRWCCLRTVCLFWACARA